MCFLSGRRNFLKTSGPAGTAGTDRHFNTLVEPAFFTGRDVWGRRKTEIASPSLARQYLGLIYGAHTFNLSPS